MKIRCLVLAVAFATAFPSYAASSKGRDTDVMAEPIPAPHENRIIKFTYSPDVIYQIRTTPALHTHIRLGDDEGLKENPVLGDSGQWRVSGGPTHLYVKPLREDLATSMTIVTNKRTYEFQLISGKKGSSVYQNVSFDYPDREQETRLQQEAQAAAVNAESNRLNAQIVSQTADPTSYDWGYDIIGDAPFKPVAVYSDDKFTYLRMPGSQVAPAVFLIDENNKPALVDFKPRGSYLVVQRLVHGLLLKVGNQEVRVMRREPSRPSWKTGD